MAQPMKPAKQSVADFWECEACGERYGEQQDEVRYQLEPEILCVAQFGTARGQDGRLPWSHAWGLVVLDQWLRSLA